MAEQVDTPGDRPARGRSAGRDVPLAIVVGLGLAAVFLVSLALPTPVFVAAVALLAVIAYREVERVLAPRGVIVDTPLVTAATLVMLIGAHLAGHSGQALGVLVLIVGAFAYRLIDRRRADDVRSLAMTVLLGVWVGLLASYAILLRDRPTGGAVAVLAVIGSAILTDVGAFAAGVKLGRHKVAPMVSPNKTWEGVAGGLVLAVVVAALVLPRLDDRFTVVTAMLLALACGVAGFLGDLGESMIKRDLGVKDLGWLLPGHGGLLDRVDGILFALPVGYHVLDLLL